MKVNARFQINFKINKIQDLTNFGNLPDVTYVPIVWFEEHVELPQDLLGGLWYLGNLSTMIFVTGSLLIFIGILPVVYGLCKCRRNDYEKMDEDTAGISTGNPDEATNDQDLFDEN